MPRWIEEHLPFVFSNVRAGMSRWIEEHRPAVFRVARLSRVPRRASFTRCKRPLDDGPVSRFLNLLALLAIVTVAVTRIYCCSCRCLGPKCCHCTHEKKLK